MSTFKFITVMQVVRQLVCANCLILIAIMQYSIIQHDRGQAMAVHISFYFIPMITFLLVIFLVFDWQSQNHFNRYLGIISQFIFLVYFIYKAIFYYRVNNDIQFYKNHFDGLFTPPNEVMWFTVLIILVILFYSVIKIKF